MNYFHLFFHLTILLGLSKQITESASLAKPGCNDSCGNNITIPFPFGIGSDDCFVDEWFEVVCFSDGRPFLKKLGTEVLNVSFDRLLITVDTNMSQFRMCNETSFKFDTKILKGSHLSYSTDCNKFIVVGCVSALLLQDKKILAGCTSLCDPTEVPSNGCYGINCCETIKINGSIKDHYLLNFSKIRTGSESCATALLVEQGWCPENMTLFTQSTDYNSLLFATPIALEWRVSHSMIPDLHFGEVCGQIVETDNIRNLFCRCPKCTEGNPYLVDGCQETGDCQSAPTVGSQGVSRKLIILIVIGPSVGIPLLLLSSFLTWKKIKVRKERKLRQLFFKRNGGHLLHQQISSDQNLIDEIILFAYRQIEKATDNFNENRVLGQGGHGTVYKGMLPDGRIVAVKRSKLIHESQVEEFINEVVILSQINHRNVVKLLGCCLEAEVPLLVYEFVLNGTLYDLLHSKNDEFIMSWDMRLRIGIEIAGAMAYLHSESTIPIFHRDIKSSNILLDEKYKAKISDFGTSRHISIGQTHVSTLVKGTFGYLDPEYFQSSQFTEKSDVYSFGVVLVELLTGKKPISLAHSEDESNLSLATLFLQSMEEDLLHTVLDTQVADSASENEVVAVAELAQRCLNLDGKQRPTMKEVARKLEGVKLYQESLKKKSFFVEECSIAGGKEIEGFAGTSMSTWTSSSVSDVYPLLSNTF